MVKVSGAYLNIAQLFYIRLDLTDGVCASQHRLCSRPEASRRI